MKKPAAWWIILTTIIISLVIFIGGNLNSFTKPFDKDYFSNLYSNSQYVVGSSSDGIGDDGLYAFAGYYYLMQGGDPSQVNFEHPPLGKYLVGISILLFNNENAINIIYLIFILIVTYKIGEVVLKNNMLSLIPPLFIVWEFHFQDHVVRSFIDLPFVLFFLLGVFFFIKGLNKEKMLYVSSLFWGCAFSTKFFPAIIFYAVLFFIIIYIYKREYIKTFVLASFLIPLIYILTHTMYFMNNHSFIEFLQHKKWMVAWWSGSPIVPFNIWSNIVTGRYTDSVGDTRTTNFWTPIIPAVTFLGLLSFRRNIFNKQNLPKLILYSTSILYLLFLTFLNGGVLKFIMPIYPLLLILSIDSLLLIFPTLRRNYFPLSK